ncbi:YmfQ family protein [Sideroxydans lithotrophicus]|uniref:DUF2313 domain-containing protein n=1 Tax=Sideroxydans lithotrophicus (strain ES-1) TaxID=580332 RepID=D5CUF2_SIDLE|nr:putative phage tail protein [Sideroxydans lithotrophicus]ADE10487.1 Protein of unknown function DUF2313, Mu protein gp48 [Sideroxydans lithotrophicus ES-1]
MNHAELLKRSLPSVAYDPNGPVISAELVAEGNALDEALRSADSILNEIDPRTAAATLDDWERVLGLSALGLSVEQRRVAAGAKYYSHGSQSRPYFIGIAEKLGFPGTTITEYKRANCNGNCNDALYSEADLFVWTMNVPALGGYFAANCNSNCNSALGSWGYSNLEMAINKDRPAHTRVMFNYV